MISISNSTGNFSLLCSEFMKMRMKIWWCLRRWTLSLCIRTQHQHMIKRSEIIQLPGSARTQERHLFWCWKQIGASKFTGPAWITQLTTPSEVIPKICPLTVCNSFMPMKISDLVMHSNMIKRSEIIQWSPWIVRRQVWHLFCIYASPSQFCLTHSFHKQANQCKCYIFIRGKWSEWVLFTINMLFENLPLAILVLCKANKSNTATLTIRLEARGLMSP